MHLISCWDSNWVLTANFYLTHTLQRQKQMALTKEITYFIGFLKIFTKHKHTKTQNSINTINCTNKAHPSTPNTHPPHPLLIIQACVWISVDVYGFFLAHVMSNAAAEQVFPLASWQHMYLKRRIMCKHIKQTYYVTKTSKESWQYLWRDRAH